MSIRGVIPGLAGSVAVAVVTVLSLGMTHASADTTPLSPPPAHVEVTPAVHPGAAPSLRSMESPTVIQPTWRHRLLQRSDPSMQAAPMEAKRRHS